MLNVIVLLGGKSSEREVSLVSGKEISKQLALNGHKVIELDPADYQFGHELITAIKSFKADLVFIGLHGGEGENGILQAMLDGSSIPYTGSGYKASAVAMDKMYAKLIAQYANVPVPQSLIFSRQDCENKLYPSFKDCLEKLSQDKLNSKLVVKPADAGSSVGVHIIDNESDYTNAIADAMQYSEKIMAEEFIAGRELTVTVLNGKALPVVEIKPHQGFYDYSSKYTKGFTDYQAPADLSTEESIIVQEYAVNIWHAMECSGYARIDFRYDGKVFYFLEVNTLPGMTPLSLTPMAAKAVGMNFGELLEAIMSIASHKSQTITKQ
jgi:D-alanine-D-alanine ligase